MIYGFRQSSSPRPLAAGPLLSELLTPAEQAFFDGLKSDKRRHDWLLGRWTGKRLVQAVIGNGIPLDGVEILSAEDGAPVVRVQHSGFRAWPSAAGTPLPIPNRQLPEITLSISHSHNQAFCGLVEQAAFPLGVDIERIEERPEAFVQDFFVREERLLVEAAPRANRAGVVTAIWSAKEASLKAVRVGWIADAFAVKCLPQGKGLDWSPVSIVWNVAKLKQPAPVLTGWWRILGDFVLTIAVIQNGENYSIHEFHEE